MRDANRLRRLVGIGSAPAGNGEAGHRFRAARAPPGDTRTPREELADGWGVKLARKRGPAAAKTPRDGAPKGAAWPQMATQTERLVR